MITEIGALVGIVKNLFDTLKTGRDIFGGGSKSSLDNFKKAQQRIEGIAEQLNQAFALEKLLPMWLQQYDDIDIYADRLTEEDVRRLDNRLRSIIHNSVSDSFSGTFFRTNFAVLPGVDAVITDFRSKLTSLQQDLNAIGFGDAAEWRRKWKSNLKLRLGDLKQKAVELEGVVDDVHAKLVEELRHAAKA